MQVRIMVVEFRNREFHIHFTVLCSCFIKSQYFPCFYFKLLEWKFYAVLLQTGIIKNEKWNTITYTTTKEYCICELALQKIPKNNVTVLWCFERAMMECYQTLYWRNLSNQKPFRRNIRVSATFVVREEWSGLDPHMKTQLYLWKNLKQCSKHFEVR